MKAETGGNIGRRLNTWKEIAVFFDRDERTVKRWEASRGLPIRRLPNGTHSKVFAYEHELTAWLDESGPSGEPAASAMPDGISAANGIARTKYASIAVVIVSTFVLACLAILAMGFQFSYRELLTARASVPRHVPNAQASAFYRTGLYEWQTRTPLGLTRAVGDFTQAIAHDPLYAAAYVGLANCYNLLREFSTMPPEEAFPRAKAAAERAIVLDPSLASAHAALGSDAF